MTTTANDPITTGVNAQAYTDIAGVFTNPNAALAGNVGNLWDFSLKDNTAPAGTTYCLRIADGTGAELGLYNYLPEVTTAAASSVISAGFVDGSGTAIATPTFSFGGKFVNGVSYQSATGTFGDSTHKLRIANTTFANGWSVSLAASGGSTALWNRTDSLAKYDFNDNGAGATDSAIDADSLGGQLSVNPTTATVTPQAGCSTTGVTLGSAASFLQGTTDDITMLVASASSQQNCYFDLTGASLTQTIPAQQPAGTYTLDMTATVVAL